MFKIHLNKQMFKIHLNKQMFKIHLNRPWEWIRRIHSCTQFTNIFKSIDFKMVTN